MSGLHRSTLTEQIHELARRLAEDYPTIPLPEVSRVVQAATDRTLRADQPPVASCANVLDEVEALARERLDEMRVAERGHRVTPERDGQGPSAARRSAPRRGAASPG